MKSALPQETYQRNGNVLGGQWLTSIDQETDTISEHFGDILCAVMHAITLCYNTSPVVERVN